MRGAEGLEFPAYGFGDRRLAGYIPRGCAGAGQVRPRMRASSQRNDLPVGGGREARVEGLRVRRELPRQRVLVAAADRVVRVAEVPVRARRVDPGGVQKRPISVPALVETDPFQSCLLPRRVRSATQMRVRERIDRRSAEHQGVSIARSAVQVHGKRVRNRNVANARG